MYNQTEIILAQYDLEIRQITKGRGYIVCDTDQGTKLLCPFKGSKEKGEWIKSYLDTLVVRGYMVERIFPNQKGEAVTEDELTGERFWLKEAIRGVELDTAHFGEMIEGAAVLARYHQCAAMVAMEEPGIGVVDVAQTYLRHAKELIKVKNYIKTKKKKMAFEQIYMQHFAQMHKTAEQSCDILCGQRVEGSLKLVCHGDCTQHNMVFSGGGWRLIHFENVVYSLAVWDLSTYLRKMMEKNEWNQELGKAILDEYQRVRVMPEEEYESLGGLLLFPEKFWKVANHYMSSNKAWIPEKDVEKLKKVMEQEALRLKFVENLFSISLE